MKKENFKIIVRSVEDGNKLFNACVENYDEFTYYFSPRFNRDDQVLNRLKYALYDKNTGIAVCYGKNKNELLEKYQKVTEKYTNLRNSKNYQKLIKEYKELLNKEEK